MFRFIIIIKPMSVLLLVTGLLSQLEGLGCSSNADLVRRYAQVSSNIRCSFTEKVMIIFKFNIADLAWISNWQNQDPRARNDLAECATLIIQRGIAASVWVPLPQDPFSIIWFSSRFWFSISIFILECKVMFNKKIR